MNLPPFPFTVLDTETTGFVPRTHRVIEFASMQAREGKVIDEYEQLLAVPGDIPPHVQVLTRIRPESLTGQPTMEEKRAEIIDRIGQDTMIVGQNLGFDIGMLKGEGIDLRERAWVDTSLLAALVFPEFRSFSLQYMSTLLKLNHNPPHRALGDVRATCELLSRIWERLCELPAEQLKIAKETMRKAPEGYRRFFEAIPESSAAMPAWMKQRVRREVKESAQIIALQKPEKGIVEIREEGVHPEFLQHLAHSALADTSTIHWIAVKNLETALNRLHVSPGMQIVHPAQQLLNPMAAETLNQQLMMTPEEATLSIKIQWFKPAHRNDIAVHGSEKDVWNGKLACTQEGAAYVHQFKTDATVFVIDHKQLLAFLADPKHAAHGALTPDAHIIIDDASMLEDTATKAYGHFCSLDDLRAAAQGDNVLTSFVDLLTLWIEKSRAGTDIHFFRADDVNEKDAKGLREQLHVILERTDLPEKTVEQLREVDAFLDPALPMEQMVWSECRINGSLFLHSASEHVDALLQKHLYDTFSTTLIVPAGSGTQLGETVPRAAKRTHVPSSESTPCSIDIDYPEATMYTYLENPLKGKTIMLAGSKRVIEQAFIRQTENLEKKGVTLICQGLGGGQGRMEADFLAAEGDTIWMLTPYMYEGIELPQGSAHHLILDQLPFDHPGHPVFSKRKDHFKNGFSEYAMPRLQHRLYRLLRTFCKHRVEGAKVLMLDPRLREKDYGKQIKRYLGMFADGRVEVPTKGTDGQMKLPL